MSILESTLDENKKQCKNQLATLKSSLATSEKSSTEQSQKLQGVIATLEEELATATSQVEDLTGQHADCVTKQGDLKSACEAKVRGLNQQIAELSAKIAALKETKQQMDAQVATLTSQSGSTIEDLTE